MYKLSFIIFILISSLNYSQTPHGENFNFDCEVCHSTNDWKVDLKKLDFNHAQTNFELAGQHKVLDCQSCHTTLKFSETKGNCFDCHTNIHQNTVEPNCEQCHNSNSWVVTNITEMHDVSRFHLLGAHKIADCKDCHTSVDKLLFQVIGSQCIDCHLSDYQSAQVPNHIEAGFSKECEDCHRVSDIEWTKANVSHDFFPLVGGHKISNCFDCHSQTTFEGLSQECLTCHQNDYNSTSNPNHTASGFSTNCLECHTTNLGWQPAQFKDHDQFFVLDGAHKTIENDCAKCHTTGFTNTPNQCYDCHQTDYNSATDPVHQSAGFGTDCESCHTTNAFEPATFDHDNQFFPIYSGEHKGEWNECSDCHTNSSNFQVFECITCHEHNQNSMNEEHSGINGYVYESNACFACHPTGSKEGGFNHSATNFPLTGAHISTQCTDCHSSGYQGTSMECNSCHLTDFQNSVNPNHQQIGLEQNCEQCHTTNPDWQPATFSVHNEFYLLEGAHASIANDCNSCHSGNYTTTKNLCYDCHTNNYNNTSNPNHQTTGFGTDCETCHSQNAWQPATFDHDNQFFPIYSGKHNNEWNDCSDCHTNSSNFQVFECINCHEHEKTKMDDEHSGIQGYQYISSECFACHPTGSEDGAFNHALSEFPLTGAHITQECSDCHQSGYLNTSTECISCHQNNFNNSSEPNHIQVGISNKCEDCHNTSVWNPSIFNHSTTGFELVGGHNLTQCSSCHSVSTANASPECYSCHADNYASAQEHVSQNYPKVCQDCHNTTNWNETTFDHNNTNFALTGVHTSTDCSSCHSNGYAGTSTECFACHESNFKNSTNPNHTNLGLSTNCNECHTTNPDWQPASFAVHNNFYVLQGAHSSISNDCATCHNGNYNTTPDDCFGCHSSDYNSTINPVHSSSEFGFACEDCHSQNDWKPATFDHDDQYFPIYSGEHRNEWNSCSDCHTNQNDYSVFSCIDCHEHNQTDMNNKHRGESGYSYNSNACYDCHPNGSEGNLNKKEPLRFE